MPLLDSDLLTVMRSVTEGKLSETEVTFSKNSACCVVMASTGYPQAYEKGYPMTLPKEEKDEVIYVAGAKLDDGVLKTNGGRVLGATAVAPTLAEAKDKAYALVEKIHFDNAFYRKDIGQRALQCNK